MSEIVQGIVLNYNTETKIALCLVPELFGDQQVECEAMGRRLSNVDAAGSLNAQDTVMIYVGSSGRTPPKWFVPKTEQHTTLQHFSRASGEQIRINHSNGFMSFYDTAGAVRRGFIQHSALGNIVVNNEVDNGQIHFFTDDPDGTSKIRLNLNASGVQTTNGDFHVHGEALNTLFHVGEGDLAYIAGINAEINMGNGPGRTLRVLSGVSVPHVFPSGAGANDLQGMISGNGFRLELGTVTDQRFTITSLGFEKAWINNNGVAWFNHLTADSGLTNNSMNLRGLFAAGMEFYASRFDGTGPAGQVKRGSLSVDGNENMVFSTENLASGTGDFAFFHRGVEKFRILTSYTTVLGQLRVATGGQHLHLIDTTNNNNTFLSFYGAGSSHNNIGTRTGYIGFPSSITMYVRNETVGGNIFILPDGETIIGSSSVERARITLVGQLLLGKTSAIIGTVGHVLHHYGALWSTTESAGLQNALWNHISGANSAGQVFASIRSDGATCGSITQVAGPTVAYNTSSDARLKNVLGWASDDEAIAKVMELEIVLGEFKAEPGNVTPMLIAQQVAEVDSHFVVKGHGEPGDDNFIPWMIDYGQISILYGGALQGAILYLVQAMENIKELRDETDASKSQAREDIATLQERVKALEENHG